MLSIFLVTGGGGGGGGGGLIGTGGIQVYSTCYHDEEIQITDDIKLKSSVYSRQSTRRAFSRFFKTHGIQAFFCSQKNQLKIQTVVG